MIHVFLFSVFLLFQSHSFAQKNEPVDSLVYKLEMAKTDSSKVDLLIKISKYYSSNDYNQSLNYGEQALQIAENLGDHKPLLFALYNLGAVHLEMGHFEIASRFYYRFLQLNGNKTKNKKLTAYVLANLGLIYFQLDKLDEAEKYYNNALEIIKSIQSTDKDSTITETLPSLYNNIGTLYKNKKDIKKAVEYYQLGIILARRMPNKAVVLAQLLNHLGYLYLNNGEPDKSMDLFNEALEIRVKTNNKVGLSASYLNIASYYIYKKENAKALDLLNKGFAIAKEVNSLALMVNYSSALYKLYQSQNQNDLALQYHVLFKNYSDSIKTNESLQELSRLELTSKFEEKEKLLTAEHERQSIIFYFIIAVLFFSSIILSLFFILSQSRNKRLRLVQENIQLESQNLELQKTNLEKELEVKNRELTTNVMYLLKKNELINDITERLTKIKKDINKDSISNYQSILFDLQAELDESAWNEFEYRFQQVHSGFYEKLHLKFPDLTPQEIKLCAFLRLNLSSKEISTITKQSTKTIDVARYRLRKKMNINNIEVNMVNFLMDL